MQTKKTMILMMGLQGSGKSTFCREILGNTYVYVNLDTLKTRHREKLLIQECVEQGKSFIVDNTNPTKGSAPLHSRCQDCRLSGHRLFYGIEAERLHCTK